jgi:hypothetical protein
MMVREGNSEFKLDEDHRVPKKPRDAARVTSSMGKASLNVFNCFVDLVEALELHQRIEWKTLLRIKCRLTWENLYRSFPSCRTETANSRPSSNRLF